MRLKSLVICAAMALFVAVAGQPAQAALVTFQSSGTFGSTGTASLTEGGITIAFIGVTTTVNATSPGEFTSFGNFNVSGNNPATGGLEAETFLLTINQIDPWGASAFSATLAGNINRNNSTATLTFQAPLTDEILGFLYTIVNAELDLPTPGWSAGIVGHVVGTSSTSNQDSIPEPASLLLFGMVAVAAARGVRRRRLAR